MTNIQTLVPCGICKRGYPPKTMFEVHVTENYHVYLCETCIKTIENEIKWQKKHTQT